MIHYSFILLRNMASYVKGLGVIPNQLIDFLSLNTFDLGLKEN